MMYRDIKITKALLQSAFKMIFFKCRGIEDGLINHS